MDDKTFEQIWNKPVITIGRITLLAAAVSSFFPIIYLMMKYDIFPPIDMVLKGWGLIASVYAAMYIAEPVSFYPVLGLSGTYMSFLSGNIGNMRVPAAAMALEVTNTDPGTREVEIISTLGMVGSIITNLLFVTIAAIMGATILNVMPEAIVNGFRSYTAPAIFGALLFQFAAKYMKLAVVGVGLPLIMKLFIPAIPAYAVTLITLVATIAASKVLYKVK